VIVVLKLLFRIKDLCFIMTAVLSDPHRNSKCIIHRNSKCTMIKVNYKELYLAHIYMWI